MLTLPSSNIYVRPSSSHLDLFHHFFLLKPQLNSKSPSLIEGTGFQFHLGFDNEYLECSLKETTATRRRNGSTSRTMPLDS